MQQMQSFQQEGNSLQVPPAETIIKPQTNNQNPAQTLFICHAAFTIQKKWSR